MCDHQASISRMTLSPLWVFLFVFFFLQYFAAVLHSQARPQEKKEHGEIHERIRIFVIDSLFPLNSTHIGHVSL